MTTVREARTATARGVLDARMSERDFQAAVIALACLRGYLTYHTHDSRRSDPGFPDLVMVKGPRIIFAELKSAKGRLALDQQTWLQLLYEADRHEVHTWRPGDWQEIEEVLR